MQAIRIKLISKFASSALVVFMNYNNLVLVFIIYALMYNVSSNIFPLFHHTAARAEDFIYKNLNETGLSNAKKERLSNLSQLGGAMLEASAAYGPGSSYGNVQL